MTGKLTFTPDGTAKHDVAGLLPFKKTADLEWSGRISVNGKTARGLVWFDDYWDTCFANLNHTAVEKLGLEFGNYLQISVPATGHKLVIAYARNWEEGARLKRPAGPKPSEFGFGAIVQPERWSPCEALFCRRVDTNLVVDDRHKAQWHEATFEVLDAQPAVPVKKSFTNALFVGAKRTYVPAVLAEKDYFEGDDLALCMKLDARVDGVTFDERMSLAEAIAKLDKEMLKLKLKPLGDFSFDVETDDEPREFTVRPWTGRKEVFAVVCAGIDSFDVFFCSRFASGKWLVTCTLDEDDAERVTRARPQILMQAKEDVSLEALLSLHDEQLQRMRQEVETLPAGLSELVQLYDTYLSAALD